ncbi:hypothetical protein HPB48_021654 [Haemaphysalis longicornis]|uniref:Uncharacterized protein n=1 Tax=Haemaphysalis longicornis TaxID=44386 RepID=A0A9J6GSR3_HAELO|nr:hypothetical protein HPB48_021654 [Haemaphysalis longicornis]
MWHLVETAAGLRVGRKPAGKVRSRLRTPLCDRARKSCESHGRATLTHGKHEERKPASKASPAVRKVREIAALRCACCPRRNVRAQSAGRRSGNVVYGRRRSRVFATVQVPLTGACPRVGARPVSAVARPGWSLPRGLRGAHFPPPVGRRDGRGSKGTSTTLSPAVEVTCPSLRRRHAGVIPRRARKVRHPVQAPWASPGCREARTMTPSGNGAENPLGKLVVSCCPGWSRGGGLAGEKPLRAGLFSRGGAIVVCGE